MAENKENRVRGFNRKSDIGCVICMKHSFLNGAETSVKMKSCSICCGPRRYCSKKCFQKDWVELGHQDECKRLASDWSIDDPKGKAWEARELKEDANRLFKKGKLEEAIMKYREVKIMAMKIQKAAKERYEMKKNESEEAMVCNYLEKSKDIDNKLAEEIKLCHRADPLEAEMTRLSAIAANNTAITYNKMNNGLQAAAAAKEALQLDPTFIDRIAPQLLAAMISLEPEKLEPEILEIANRFERIKRWKMSCGDASMCSHIVFDQRFMSYKQLVRSNHEDFYRVIDKERKLSEEGKTRFTDPFCCIKDDSKWGCIDVGVSIVPLTESQWLSLSIKSKSISITNIFSDNFLEYENLLRLRPADPEGSADDVDHTMHSHKPGSISHVAGMGALKNAHREIILFVHDLEREGLQVNAVRLGAGLFNLLPPERDPQKHQRRHKGKADKYILYSGRHLPEHCQVFPAINHVRGL